MSVRQEAVEPAEEFKGDPFFVQAEQKLLPPQLVKGLAEVQESHH